MKRSLFALAALYAVCTTAQAQSSITLYGIVDAGFGFTGSQRVAETSGAVGRPIVYRGASTFSFAGGTWSGNRWGLKGSETLDPGLSAIFQLENGFNIGTSQPANGRRLFGRQAFMGLASEAFGTVTLGRQYDPIVTYVAPIGPGAFTSGVTVHPGDLDNLHGQSRENNAIAYKSPSISGFRFGALYGFGDQPGSMKHRSTWSLGGQYADGPLAIGVAYLEANNVDGANHGAWSGAYDGTFSSSVTEGFASSKNIRIIAAASTYKTGLATLGVSYGNTQYSPGSFSVFSSRQTFNAFGLNVAYQETPALRVGLGYGYARGNAIRGASASQYHTFSAAVFYSLSKRIALYAVAGYQAVSGTVLDPFGNLVNATATVGDIANGRSSADRTQTAMRVGMRHIF